MNVTGQVALLTGAKRIGAVVARRLAAAGADIALAYNRSRGEAQATADAVAQLGRRAHLVQVDLTDAGACGRFVDDSAAALGRVDILINMASIYVSRPLADLSVEEFDANLAIDLRAAYLCSRAAWPHMRRQGGGQIINFSDWLARSGRPRYPGYLAYYVAKTAVIGLTEGLALELAPDKIRVNAIAPGPIVAPPDTSDDEIAAVEKSTPLGSWGGEEAIADAVAAILGCRFMTGETIRIDGGRHVK